MVKALVVSLATVTASSFVQADHHLLVKKELVTWGHSTYAGDRSIDVVIIHSSFNPVGPDSFDVQSIIALYKRYNVSAHYLIDRQGVIHQLVEERDISWHAGQGRLPDGRKNINASSIGIEIINTKHSAPNDKQYTSLAALIKNIRQRHSLTYITGHSDIAAGRKSDPWRFDWSRLRRLLGS